MRWNTGDYGIGCYRAIIMHYRYLSKIFIRGNLDTECSNETESTCR